MRLKPCDLSRTLRTLSRLCAEPFDRRLRSSDSSNEIRGRQTRFDATDAARSKAFQVPSAPAASPTVNNDNPVLHEGLFDCCADTADDAKVVRGLGLRYSFESGNGALLTGPH